MLKSLLFIVNKSFNFVQSYRTEGGMDAFKANQTDSLLFFQENLQPKNYQ